ncbi:hypothetical protein HYH03_005500 [Edaphochlamys debaryana]|uniref:DNL-type domain-containing protein n=1 Tax=Edaphochlamys debaryana TaxID=47281 RepID=A0A835Y737_9CHLO|nr:hypothetical protein HYH03_005500 [Edaphochlamys debaryana]|eukprot:KAG2496267.1 hypothetical protein HYH03_005500 [Edaphochlamys debaryana]
MLLQRASCRPWRTASSSRRCFVSVRAHASSEGPAARPVALPSGTLWLLDSMQDQYYNVRGAAFVIPRVEGREEAAQSTRAVRAKFHRAKSLPARSVRPAPGPTSLSLIQQAVAQQPTALTLISDGPLVDVDVEAGPGPAAAAPAAPAAAEAPPATSSCTGIVYVGPSTSADAPEEVEGDLFQSSTTSPRRTKMLRFTCLSNGCKAVNIKPISPDSFASGTVFAQCGRCNKWHLIRDHLGLWDQSRRTVYRNGKRVPPRPKFSVEQVPEALRPAPEDLDFFANGGKVSGFETHKDGSGGNKQ